MTTIPRLAVCAFLCAACITTDGDTNPNPLWRFGDGELLSVEERQRIADSAGVIHLNYGNREANGVKVDSRRVLTVLHSAPSDQAQGWLYYLNGAETPTIGECVAQGTHHSEDDWLERKDWLLLEVGPIAFTKRTVAFAARQPEVGQVLYVVGYRKGGTGDEGDIVEPAHGTLPPKIVRSGRVVAPPKGVDTGADLVFADFNCSKPLSGLSGAPVLALQEKGRLSVVGLWRGTFSENRITIVQPLPEIVLDDN